MQMLYCISMRVFVGRCLWVCMWTLGVSVHAVYGMRVMLCVHMYFGEAWG